jgi:hypothetical protein
VKYFIIPLILILTSCSLDKNSAYWNEDPIKKSVENEKLSKILNKTDDFRKMTFEEFDLFIKDYSKNSDYPDINN